MLKMFLFQFFCFFILNKSLLNEIKPRSSVIFEKLFNIKNIIMFDCLSFNIRGKYYFTTLVVL